MIFVSASLDFFGFAVKFKSEGNESAGFFTGGDEK
jgi:hypothetical protein